MHRDPGDQWFKVGGGLLFGGIGLALTVAAGCCLSGVWFASRTYGYDNPRLAARLLAAHAPGGDTDTTSATDAVMWSREAGATDGPDDVSPFLEGEEVPPDAAAHLALSFGHKAGGDGECAA